MRSAIRTPQPMAQSKSSDLARRNDMVFEANLEIGSVHLSGSDFPEAWRKLCGLASKGLVL